MAEKKKDGKERPPASLNKAVWRYSKAKDKIAQDIIDGLIPRSGPIDVTKLFYELYEDNPLFKDFPFDKDRYQTRIKTIREAIDRRYDWAKQDHTSIQNDNALHPKKATNVRGEKRWDGSDAQRLLKIDMEAGIHEQMSPQELHNSRPEYYEDFSLKVFRKHIEQAKQSAKKFKNDRKRKKGHFGDKTLSTINESSD